MISWLITIVSVGIVLGIAHYLTLKRQTRDLRERLDRAEHVLREHFLYINHLSTELADFGRELNEKN